MTATTDTFNQSNYSPAIKELQAAIAVDPTDVITKLNLASQYEEEGFVDEAAEVYRDIIKTDTEGVFAASAEQALKNLGKSIEADPPTQSPQQSSVPAPDPTQSYSENIEALRREVTADPSDMVAQISLANAFESEGHAKEAASVYVYIIENDKEEVFSASAQKALEDLQERFPNEQLVGSASPKQEQTVEPEVVHPREKQTANDIDFLGQPKPTKPSNQRANQVLSRLRDLPIAQKQFGGMLLSSLLTLTGVVGAGIAITTTSGQSQLREQASSELAVNEIQYDIKINQMGFGFRGQSDNVAVIEAATEYAQTRQVSPGVRSQVDAILKNEIQARNIEFATLVGNDKKIIVNANENRAGDTFDPNGLVSEVLANPSQIKTSELIPWEEIEAEKPPLPEGTSPEDKALVRYTVTPVTSSGGQVVGVLVSGDLVLEGKVAIPTETVKAFDSGYSAVYHINDDGSFNFSTAASETLEGAGNGAAGQLVIHTSIDEAEALALPTTELLEDATAANGEIVTSRKEVAGQSYTLAAVSLKNNAGQPVAILVRGTPVENLNALLRSSLLLQVGVGVVAITMSAVLAGLLGRAISKPIQDLQKAAQDFGQGDLSARAEAETRDEIGLLAETFNEMAEDILTSTEAIARQSEANEREAIFQRKERERLQQGVIRLLLRIEEARRGDLRVQALVDEGEVGSIADAFNATMRSLQDLVAQVQSSANQVHDSAISNTGLITQLSDEARLQEQSIQSAEKSVQGIAQSIQSVAKSAQVAAKIARTSRLAAQQGQQTMDETVSNIDTIRTSVADTSKKAKRLAESSQEISKIVNIISDISEKTNLLAFNASIEATRAGENGQGFRVVADEVRRLAEQVTSSAQEIEQLIGGIQEETVEMMKMMEDSTSQVVTGTELVRKTKTTLQNVARISEEIDKVLNSISKATVSQREASKKVTQTMKSVATVAQKTATQSETMSEQLGSLSEVAIALQESSSKFKVN
ncbi:methyl-accepting chemotaxis sensory transducer [[Leptolyngbya] sp. PCC 7376]|uniref:methyl-accepting chemotaxis protein n=1 Tax=[Leptolyngbya] sp. PCC 7376 TaxID=111781 RepID=UPI00029EE298|nr:methyl-accepting chemotaxis protein [[Leptolyngbya] sp. PCC 7376]AFY37107.1 methyl-accepting chemotaxis sensory transducer [[Leptolyngbya] sp. PCC 7376]